MLFCSFSMEASRALSCSWVLAFVGLQGEELLLGEDPVLPVGVQVHDDPGALLPLGRLGLQGPLQMGGLLPSAVGGLYPLQHILQPHRQLTQVLDIGHDRRLQLVDADGPIAAGCLLHLPIGGAAVVFIGAVVEMVGLLVHDPAALSAAYQPREQVRTVRFRGAADFMTELDWALSKVSWEMMASWVFSTTNHSSFGQGRQT